MKKLYEDGQFPSEGPWNTEMDYLAWIDSITFYPCLMKRNFLGAWTGYVGLDEKHNLYGIDISGEEFRYIEIALPLQYTLYLDEDARAFSPPKKFWFVGIGCMGESDLVPNSQPKPKKDKERISLTYRTQGFVIEQVGYLALQLSRFDTRIQERDL
jgi:hypothetical protein